MPTEPAGRVYRRPPITEAVIEMRFATAANEARIKKAADWLGPKYGEILPQQNTEVKFDFALETAVFERGAPSYRLSNSDQTNVLTVKDNSATWSRLAPYEGWDSFRTRFAVEAEQIFKAFAEPSISRIGLRFINRIDVPKAEGEDIVRYEDYLNFHINAGPMFDPLDAYQWVVQKRDRETGLSLIVQSAIAEQEIPGTGAFVFDIDVFDDAPRPARLTQILDRLDTMRNLKNTIFEAGITDRARQDYL